MGQFAIVITGIGGHGCERSLGDGDHVIGCQRPDCPDCIAREFTRRLKRNGVQNLTGQIVHWYDMNESHVALTDEVGRNIEIVPQESTVVDDLVTGERTGSF